MNNNGEALLKVWKGVRTGITFGTSVATAAGAKVLVDEAIKRIKPDKLSKKEEACIAVTSVLLICAVSGICTQQVDECLGSVEKVLNTIILSRYGLDLQNCDVNEQLSNDDEVEAEVELVKDDE